MDAHEYTNEVQRGEQLFQKGEVQDALTVFESVLSEQPDNLIALNNKGVALNSLGRYHQAIDTFLTVLEKSGNSTAACNLILNYVISGRWREAEQALMEYGSCILPQDITTLERHLERRPDREAVGHSSHAKAWNRRHRA